MEAAKSVNKAGEGKRNLDTHLHCHAVVIRSIVIDILSGFSDSNLSQTHCDAFCQGYA